MNSLKSKQAVQIRQATNADVFALAELGATTFSEAFSADNAPADMQAYLAEAFNLTVMEQELSDPKAIFFVAELSEKLVGYAKLRLEATPDYVQGDKPVELQRLYVLQAWIGHGIGANLMQHCLTKAQEDGFKTVWLGVWEQNQRALAFYRKWNFVETGKQKFVLGMDTQTDFVMEHLLT